MLNNIDNFEKFFEFIKSNRKNITEVIDHPWYSTTCCVDDIFILIDHDKGFARINKLDLSDSTDHVYMKAKHLKSLADLIVY